MYQVTSVWDKEKRKRRKISEYIGKVNESGIVYENRETVHVYGNPKLLLNVAIELEPALRSCFPPTIMT